MMRRAVAWNRYFFQIRHIFLPTDMKLRFTGLYERNNLLTFTEAEAKEELKAKEKEVEELISEFLESKR